MRQKRGTLPVEVTVARPDTPPVPPDAYTKERLDRLVRGLDELVSAGEALLGETAYRPDDRFGFMALTFFRRQQHHVSSLKKLIPGHDAALVARTMLEGMAQLLWASHKPAQRAGQWERFAAVADWRTLNAFDAFGTPVSDEDRGRVHEFRRKWGPDYETRRARGAKQEGKDLPDPYHSSWLKGVRLREVFEAIGGLDIYINTYRSFSDWHHWSPAGVGQAVEDSLHETRFNPHSLMVAVVATLTATHCVYDTLKVLNDHFDLAGEERLHELRQKLVEAATS